MASASARVRQDGRALKDDTIDVCGRAALEVRASEHHVIACFDTLDGRLNGSGRAGSFDHGDQSCPFFVTLKRRTSKGYTELRGCIGTLSPRPLRHLCDYAIKSAFEDRRFSPLRSDELPELEISVSLLVGYEPAEHPHDWIVGTHGIIIEFEDGHGSEYTATYLPDVAPEQGWSVEQTVASLVRKAGYHRKLPSHLFAAMRVTRYRSSKYALTYEQWAAVRKPDAASGASDDGATFAASSSTRFAGLFGAGFR